MHHGNRQSPAGRWARDVRRCAHRLGILLGALLTVGCEEVELRAEPSSPAIPSEGEAEAAGPTDPEPGNVTALSVGPRSSCAIVGREALWCWGSAGHGLLGESPGPGPVRVASGQELSAVSVGDDRVCYLAEGTPYCFGVVGGFGPDYGYYSEPEIAYSPQPVGGLESVDAVSVARNQSCFLSGGVTRCLGDAPSGAGSNARSSRPSIALSRDARSLATGASHSCVATTDGKVSCWGSNAAGQLPGSGVRGYTLTAAELDMPEGARQVASSPTGALTCALGAEDAIVCWGAAGDVGAREGMRVGDGPVALEGAAEPIARIAVGLLEVYAVADSGALYRYAVGDAERDPEGGRFVRYRTELEGPARVDTAAVAQVGVGLSHTCALGQDGHVRCWGLPVAGRLGAPAEDAVGADAPVLVRFEAVEGR